MMVVLGSTPPTPDEPGPTPDAKTATNPTG